MGTVGIDEMPYICVFIYIYIRIISGVMKCVYQYIYICYCEKGWISIECIATFDCQGIGIDNISNLNHILAC